MKKSLEQLQEDSRLLHSGYPCYDKEGKLCDWVDKETTTPLTDKQILQELAHNTYSIINHMMQKGKDGKI